MAATSIIHSDGERVLVIDLLNPDADETTATLKVDISTLAVNAKGQVCTELKIAKIWFNILDQTIDIFVDATTDQLIWTLGPLHSGFVDFKSSGLLKAPTPGAGGFTGDIVFKMRGGVYAAATSGYAIRLECEKIYG